MGGHREILDFIYPNRNLQLCLIKVYLLLFLKYYNEKNLRSNK